MASIKFKFIAKNLFRTLLFITTVGFVLSLAGCSGVSEGMLNPKGVITYQERKLFFDTLALMLIVVLPVIIMSLAFVYHYQASHHVNDYKPNWGHSHLLEALWWGIPCAIILVLAILTWKKTYELDPYAPIKGMDKPPLVIQAIALPWKWLFIYPAQGIATLNYMVMPLGEQVEVQITTDNVPMSAFFIPQIGSQIYAMAGMRTRLHLIANAIGVFDGLNTQYNGDGFSDMHFSVHVVTPERMQEWLTQANSVPGQSTLDDATYTTLLKPSMGDQPKFFTGASQDLFNKVIMTYMHSFGTSHPRSQIGYSTKTI